MAMRSWRLLGRGGAVVACAALIVAACGWSGARLGVYAQRAPGYAPEFEEADCPFEVYEGEDISCGYLYVPEDRTQPDGAQVELAVAIIGSTSRNPQPDPVVYLEGGPGGSALSDPDFWLDSPLRDTRDIILFDQRGTGFSLPSLDCWETTDYAENEETEFASSIDAAAACRVRLVEEGVDLTQYNSAASAADADDLRQALGIEQWNLYGVSYGTRLAMTIMRDFPAGVRSVLLDSAYPPDVDGYTEEARNSIVAIDVLLAGCAADAECNDAFPDLSARFYDLVATLNDEPVEIDGYATTGDDLVNFLFGALYDTETIPYLPLVIHEAANGNYEPWTALEAGDEEEGYHRRQDEEGDAPENDGDADGMFYSVECRDAVPFSDLDQAAKLVEDYPPQVTEGLLASTEETFAICELWGAGVAPPRENKPVVSRIPTLILAGEYDPVTPPAWSKRAGRWLFNDQYVEVARGGHAVSFLGECGPQLAAAFFDNPEQPLDTSCLAGELLPFALNVSELP